MSAQPNAAVVSLIEYRDKTEAERKSNGRRMGNHGNRASAAMRSSAVGQLADSLAALDEGENLSLAVKERIADAAGVDVRTLNRWWASHLRRAVEAHPPEQRMPRYLFRFENRNELQLLPEEVAFFAQHTRTIDAIVKVREDPDNRLSNFGVSTLYRAYANVAESVRVGARKGAEAARNCEATYPTTGRDVLNETWSIDEYDLKIRAQWDNAVIEPKVLIVRERASGLPLAYTVVPVAANGTDTGRVLAAAALGYAISHPDDPGRSIRIGGIARHLVSDQGAPFIGGTGVAAARRLGLGINSMPSHQPQANGDHEQMHQSLKAYFVDGPGSRRGWTDRAGQRLDHSVVPYEWALEQVEAWFTSHIFAEYTAGPRKGRNRLEVYLDLLEAGEVYDGHDISDEDCAALAVVVGERKYDKTRGVHFANQHWLGPELGTVGRQGDRITLKQLLDPSVLYAFDNKDRYIGVIKPRQDQDLDDIAAQYANRAARERFVKDQVAHPKAEAANKGAQAVWDETGEGLAEANENPDAPDPDEPDAPTLEAVPDQPPAVPSRTRRKTTRKAKTPSPRGDVDPDAEADRIADLYRTARNHDADQQPPKAPTEEGDGDAD